MTNGLKAFMLAGRTFIVLLLLVLMTSMGAFAQKQRPTSVVGEMIITVPHGTLPADVQVLAGKVNAVIVKNYGAIDFDKTVDAYYLRIPNGATPASTTQAIAALKADPLVRYAGPNRLRYPLQTGTTTSIPNDPRFPEQWDKTLLRLPEAWTLEKGKSSVVIAVIDSGVDIDHPEFQGRVLPGIDSFRNTQDPRDKLVNGHGTHVAGIAMAQGDNGIGIAGVAQQNVKLLPIAALNDDAANPSFPTASMLTAFQFVLTQRNAMASSQFVLNLSLGGRTASDTPDLTDPENMAILNLAKNNVLITIGAGNDFNDGNPSFSPANMASAHPNIICVTACGKQGEHATYSEARPYTTVTAPGGNDPTFVTPALQILSTFPLAYNSAVYPVGTGGYGTDQGTSMAAPQVAGVAALLLSIPGVSAGSVKDILTSTARRGTGVVPSPEFGYGIVDAYAALLKVAVAVTIQTPDGTGGKASGNGRVPDPIETLRPVIRIQVSQITPDNLSISIDGGPAIRQGTTVEAADPFSTANGVFYVIENVRATVKDTNGNDVPATYEAVIRNADLAPGQHTITVVGIQPGTGGAVNRTVTDTRKFTITPHLIPAGRSMISFPYYQFQDTRGQVATDRHVTVNAITPETYLGTDFRLARWLPDQERYVFYSSFGPKDAESGFVTPSTITRQDGDPASLLYAKFPLGLGFWSDTASAKPVLTRGQPLTDRPFIIPLKGNGSGDTRFISWNMIGDPFPFDVPFNALLVDTPEGRLSIQQAADKGYILPNIYSYDGDSGYTFRSLPDGAIRAWTGHWVGVTSRVDINLVVPPLQSSRAASVATRAVTGTGKDGWSLKLSAHTRDLHDTYNFIGVASRAVDTFDLKDVAKPPMVSPYVSLGVSHSDWGNKSGLYAQDMRSSNGTKQWNVVITTDQPNSDVTFTWDNATVPRGTRLMLKDEATGISTDMRTRNALTFNSGSDVAPRRFTITSQLVTGPSVLRITNVNVRTRGTSNAIGFNLSSDATYEVKILNSTGNPINTLTTRAAGTGDVQMIWNGRDNNGRNVAAGTYIVQIRATNADKETVKAIQPFTIVR